VDYPFWHVFPAAIHLFSVLERIMKKLWQRIFVMIFGVGLGLLPLVPLAQTSVASTNSYFAASIDKHRVLHQTPSPKIVFVGGSNLAFGLDSPQIEEKFRMPVVNMGVHASLGLRYMLDEIKEDIHQGDIIIISPEYEQFFGGLNGGESLLYDLSVFPQGLAYVHSPSQYQVILISLPFLIQSVPKRLIGNLLGSRNPDIIGVYNRTAFNSHGDVVAHLDEPSPLNISGLPPLIGSSHPLFWNQSKC
jgi:hypothetical protein